IATFLLLLALSLIGFGFSIIGVAGSLVDSVWKLVALDIGLAIVIGFSYPHIRGVKKGDFLATTVYYNSRGAGLASVLTGVSAVALQNGRKGDKIKINFQGRQAEGVVIAYASTFSPAVVRVTEIERIAGTHVTM
ncbi:hypothetical protein HY571_02040, partial [Candidatus Micrarchaeota archaeon]|nr:hypothetical protein [Candidatus Micrarchaeota archaeon]